MTYDLIIIGAGPAGLTAGIYARSRKLKTLILEAGSAGGQLVSLYPDKGIENYPGCVLTQAEKLAKRMVTHALSMGCELHENEMAHDILEKDGRLLVVTDKQQYETKAVIIAAGIGLFKPKTLGIPGEDQFENKGVFYKIPDKESLVDKRVLFVGGGNSALEMALIASEVAETYIVHRRNEFRADESVIEKVKRSSIKTILNAELEEIKGDQTVNSVTIKVGGDRKVSLDVDVVVINIGYTPDLKDIQRWNVELEDNLIKVDTAMRTSRPGVFACGDVVTYRGKYKQIVTACGEAATAANSAYKYIMKPYWS
ncbi:MAG: NAD(P)/FAD-dependent oxidoreductase [Methanomassiliicoccales archaeon]|jgi:thioredoxin reductase (NADPH)|nr:NAD(P)/FAD-dependent oxidoreductase [Methanomassiliicoccales archaeon]